MGRTERAIVLLALAAAGSGWAVPAPAEAQNATQDSCTEFSQALISQVYSASPWQIGAAVQQAVAQLAELLQNPSLQSTMTRDASELGALTGAPTPTVTVTPNDSQEGGLAT